MIYWDTSALVKLYCSEEGSEELTRVVEESTTPCWTSVLTETEIFYAFQQKFSRDETGGTTPSQLLSTFQKDVQQERIVLIPLGNEIMQEARELAQACFLKKTPISLRSLDGLHLASAKAAKCTQLITSDEGMKQAAAAAGLKLEHNVLN